MIKNRAWELKSVACEGIVDCVTSWLFHQFTRGCDHRQIRAAGATGILDHSGPVAELGGERGEVEEGVSLQERRTIQDEGGCSKPKVWHADDWRSCQGEVSPEAANSSSSNPAAEIQVIEDVADYDVLR